MCIVCTTYQTIGSVGLITSGAGRDLDQVRPRQLPYLGVHRPVRVGGVMVYPDDLLYADVNEVTTIPKEIASEVGDAYVGAEIVILDTLRQFGPDARTLNEARKKS